MADEVDEDRFRRRADDHRRQMAARDPHFAIWADAAVGDPVVVHDLEGRPRYHTVPVELGGRAIGFVRVTSGMAVEAAGGFYRNPRHLESCPLVVTGITAAEARSAVATAARLEESDLDDPLYVHDGPPGREAWSVETNGRPRRRFLVTRGGVEERNQQRP